jgi:hypothetical protein
MQSSAFHRASFQVFSGSRAIGLLMLKIKIYLRQELLHRNQMSKMRGPGPLLFALVPLFIIIAWGFVATGNAGSGTNAVAPFSLTSSSQNQLSIASTNGIAVMEVNHAIMVTAELDFGSIVPTISEALQQVERRSQPDDGRGRTFAILDAYGEPTPQRKLHISMHISTEKPGFASLIFRRTGQILWQSRIISGTNSTKFTGKNLAILLGDGAGHSVIIDGSRNPPSVLEALIKDQGVPVSTFWPEGEEREVTFMYSACGCPVKVMAKRSGDRTFRTKNLPVIFPDDPAVVGLINRLMGW